MLHDFYDYKGWESLSPTDYFSQGLRSRFFEIFLEVYKERGMSGFKDATPEEKMYLEQRIENARDYLQDTQGGDCRLARAGQGLDEGKESIQPDEFPAA